MQELTDTQQLTDVRSVQHHWRYSVANFGVAAMALSVMFIWIATDRYESFAESNGTADVLSLARKMLAAPYVIGAVSVFAALLLYRWASRRSRSEVGIALAGWVFILGIAAQAAEPFRVGRGAVYAAAIWGAVGIALVRHAIATIGRGPRWVADVVAIVLLIAFMFLVFDAAQAFPDFGGFRGFRGGD